MATSSISWTPWHQVVKLREDLLTGELAMNQFAADLYEVLMQRGKIPIYENVDSFFALTFPAANLRRLAGDVMQRLAGKNDKAVHQLALTYGGGKTHTLITLAHLVRNPAMLPNTPAVDEFRGASGMQIPQARVAALCFDKIDAEDGLEVLSPSGQARRLKYPWSILAWQIAGNAGLSAINLEHPDEERSTPPAEEPLARLLAPSIRNGMPLLILVDEVLMYAYTMTSHSQAWRAYLTNFFQALTQAVSKANNCCLVASILSSDPKHNTELGMHIEADLSNIFGRQQQGAIVSVTRDEVSEILRRRFFTPESVRDVNAFRPHVQKALSNISVVDEYTKGHMAEQESVYVSCYPFHPEISDVFFSKWNSLPTFQRTRGLLRTFALALRDAVVWDRSPLIGPAVFLPYQGNEALPAATQELVRIADEAVSTHSSWNSILRTELDCAAQADSNYGLKFRETEQAVISVFLHSQPIGMDCPTSKLWPMIGTGKPQKIDLDKALRFWADNSFWLDDQLTGSSGIPDKWKMGNKPNLNQMHDSQRKLLSQGEKSMRLLDQLRRESSLLSGVDAGVVSHKLPNSPADIADDGKFHYVVLPPEGACNGSRPSAFAQKFLKEVAHENAPRVHRNAIVLLAPSKDGLDLAMERAADVIAWQKVKDNLKQHGSEGLDAARLSTLGTYIQAANGKLSEAIRQAWCTVVTLSQAGEPQAFKLNLGSSTPFAEIKRDKRTRVHSTAINPEALMPEGSYDLWGENDQFRSVRDILGTFTKRPDMPKMISLEPVRDTLKNGCLNGIFVLRLPRPDGSARTWWKSRPDSSAMEDQALEVWLPEFARLESVDVSSILPDSSEGLWPESSEEITVRDILKYFSGERIVTRHMDGYDEKAPVPAASKKAVFEAVARAVKDGQLWLLNVLNDSTSVLGEDIPAGRLTEDARLRRAPDPIGGFDLAPEQLLTAWTAGTSTAKQIADALSQKKGLPLPWITVRNAIEAAMAANCIEVDPAGGTWPCDRASATKVLLRIPSSEGEKQIPSVKIINMGPEMLFDLSDASSAILDWGAKNEARVNLEIKVTTKSDTGTISKEKMQALYAIFDKVLNKENF